MNDIEINPIGAVETGPDGASRIKLDAAYIPGLRGLGGFSHLVVIWWADRADPDCRAFLDAGMPYSGVESPLGIFATRSPMRPNPLCITVIEVADIDREEGAIDTWYIDAEPGTPVLDIKPYTPSIDRVASPKVPAWCEHWPVDVETSGDFDWEAEFRF